MEKIVATIVFIIIAGTGLFTTRFLLRTIARQEGFSKQMHAITAAFGLGITWWFSILFPVAIANNFNVEGSLFLFMFYISLGAGVMTYLIDFFLLSHIRKK